MALNTLNGVVVEGAGVYYLPGLVESYVCRLLE